MRCDHRHALLLVIGLAATALTHSPVRAQATDKAATGSTGSPVGVTPRPEELNVGADKGVTTLNKFFVNDDKLKPFSGANVDLPRTIDDVQAYTFFDAKDIDMSGATNVEDFLRQNMTMETSSYSQSQNFFLGGNPSSINLRGLGDGQTLILINGRRAPAGNLALNGGGSQVNLNSIPMGAVDRIEVLPTSASSIYGGNAVGGVVNIVLKRNFNGGHMRFSYQNPERSDAPIRRFDSAYGFTLEGGRTRVTLTSGYSDMKLLQRQDRPFLVEYERRYYQNAGVINIVLPIGATANIRPATGTANLVLKNGGGSIGSSVTFVPYGISATTPAAELAAGLRANAGKINQDPATANRQFFGGSLEELGTGQRGKSFGLTVRREMNDDLELNVDFMISNDGHTRNGTIRSSQTVSAAAPSNPFTTAVSVNVPLPGEFPQWSSNVSRQLSLGFVYSLPRDWRAQGDYTWSSTGNSFYAFRAGSAAAADVTADLNAGRLNPFVDTSLYPFDLTSYQGRYSQTGNGGANNVALRFAGPVGRLPAGSPRLSLGLDHYQQGQSDGDVFQTYENYPARNTRVHGIGKRQTTNSAYAEAQIPLVAAANQRPLIRQLSLQLAARAEDYDVRTGTASITLLPVPATPPRIFNNRAHYRQIKPTAGFSYKPVRSLLLRGSFSRGFVTPRFSQLSFNPTPSTTTSPVVDPQRGGIRTDIYTIAGGNPNLLPESSQSWNAGLVFQPETGRLQGLRVSVDYIFTRKQDNFGSLTSQQIVNFEEDYPDRVIRAAPEAGSPFGVGAIETVNISTLNLYWSYAESFEVSVGYRKKTNGLGSFSALARGTFTNHDKRKWSLTQPILEYANVSDWGGLKLQGNASLTWEYQRVFARWNTRFYSRHRIPGPPFNPLSSFVIPQGSEFMPWQAFADLLIGYRFPERGRAAAQSWADRALPGVEIQLGIDNPLNKIPLYDVYSNYPYSPRGNARLRDYRLSVKKPF